MRLYNAQSRTPVGSNMAPKRTPSRTGLPPRTSPSAYKLEIDKRKAADKQVTSKSSSLLHRTSTTTAALFNPFEIDTGIQFPRDPFFAKGGSRGSGGTSATGRLTPLVSSESHDLFALSSEADDFVTFPEAACFADTDGDLFNDANTWMTSFSSSTLSTKFTNHEMNAAKLGRGEGGSRAFSSFPSFDHRPNEVFVKTPQPQYSLNDDMFSSFDALVAEKPKSQLFQAGSNEPEAFDPFARDATSQEPVHADHFSVSSSAQGYNYVPSHLFQSPINEPRVVDPFGRELTPPPAIHRNGVREGCFPISYPPQENNYVAVKADLRKVSRNLYRQPLSSLSIQKKAVEIKSQNKPIALLPMQVESRSASIGRKEISEPVSSPDTSQTAAATKNTAQKRHVAAEFVSKHKQVNSKMYPATELESKRAPVIVKGHPAVELDSTPEPVIPTESYQKRFPPSASSKSARPDVENLLSDISKRKDITRSERAPGSSIATNNQVPQQHALRRVEKADANERDAAPPTKIVVDVSYLNHFATALDSKHAPVIEKGHTVAELDSTQEPVIPTVSYPKRFPPSVTSMSGRPHVENWLSDISKRKDITRSERAPGSSIAKNNQVPQQHALRRVEKADANERDAAPPTENVAQVSSLKDFVLSATAPTHPIRMRVIDSEASPVATNSKEGTQGKVLEELLKRRACKHGERHSTDVKVQDQTVPRSELMSANGAKNEMCTADEPENEPPLKDDPKYSKYFKMKKMGLPSGAVKNAMERDGMDPAILDLDPEIGLRAQSTASDDGPPLKEDPDYTKYWKMMKMGLPVDSVKNALQRDGKDPSIIDLDPEKSLKSQRGSPGEDKNDGPPLCEDPEYSKYFRMLKMQLPLEAVKNAMERDGKDPSIMELDATKSLKSQRKSESKGGMREHGSPKDKFRRIRVHWETHDAVRSNTLWAMVNRDSDVAELNVEEEEFTSLFQAELKPVQQSAPTGATEQGAVKVIDKKRANNGGITLARIKLSYSEVAAAVDSYDEAALSQEEIRGILQYLPTSEEKTALRNYLGNVGDSKVDGLCECEKFMVAIMAVKHAKRKLNAILYMQKFASSLEELRRDARLVKKACEEIMGSSRLRKVLGMILNLGNRLNTAGAAKKEPALAITLESLLKLNQLRAFDKKTTFLQFVASVVRRNDPTLCHFKDDLTTVFVADKLIWDHTLAELKRMENQLESVRMLALYHGSSKDRPFTSSRGSVGGDDATVLSMPKIRVEEETNLLRRTSIGNFTLDACARMATVVGEIENTKSSYNALLLYFGEEGKKGLQPNDVFQTISTFCKDFEASVAVVIDTEKAQFREAKRSRKLAPASTSEPDESDGSTLSGGLFRKRAPMSMGGVQSELRSSKPNLKRGWQRREHSK